MLDWDEIKAKFEELYDEVCSKVKETEDTNDQIKWQEIERYLDCILEILDDVGIRKRLMPLFDRDVPLPSEEGLH